MQRVLRGLGYNLVADGKVGPATRGVVSQFQRQANFERAAGGGRVANAARGLADMQVNGELDANTRGWLRLYANVLGTLDQSNRPGDLQPWF